MSRKCRWSGDQLSLLLLILVFLILILFALRLQKWDSLRLR